ncbi:secretion system protein E, partial [Halobacteriales archaeon SW_8_68_21]
MSNEDAERSASRTGPEGDSSASDASPRDERGTDADTEPVDPTDDDTPTETSADAATETATDAATETTADTESSEATGSPDPDERAFEPPEFDDDDGQDERPPVVTDRYTWRSLLTERGHGDAARRVYADVPDAPAVPADAVTLHLPDRVDDVIRAAGVDEPFEADGETAVPDHGTPERDTLVVGSDTILLDGSAVVPT